MEILSWEYEDWLRNELTVHGLWNWLSQQKYINWSILSRLKLYQVILLAVHSYWSFPILFSVLWVNISTRIILSYMSVYFISRDLTTSKIKVCLLHNGPCGVLMTGEVSFCCEWFHQSWYFSLILVGFLWYSINRNRFMTCILKLCKENLGRWPKIIGMDVVEMALWAQVWSFAFCEFIFCF